VAKFGASKVLFKPAAPGTGLIVNRTSRALLELAGIKDILSKSMGGRSKINVAKATMLALANLRQSEEPIQMNAEAQEEKTDETE
jgi:small subunit ribosomal protein S5